MKYVPSTSSEVGCMVILSCLSPDTVARRIGDQLRHMRSLGVAFEQPSPFIFNVKIRKDVPSFITSSHHAFPDLKTSTSSFATARCSIEVSQLGFAMLSLSCSSECVFQNNCFFGSRYLPRASLKTF